jgi:hypothetical protein
MNEKDFNQYLEIDFLEDNFKQEFSTKKADT